MYNYTETRKPVLAATYNILPRIDVQTKNHVEKTLSEVPPYLQKSLLKIYETKKKHSLREANLYFLDVQDLTKGKKLWMDFDDLKSLAERRASYCVRVSAEKGAVFAEKCGIEAPDAKEEKSVYLRLSSPKWWERKLITKLKRERELFAIQTGHVHKLASPYCSNHAYEAIKRQDELNKELMKEIKLVSGIEEITLYDAWKSSTSNPYNRFVELVTRVKGFEEYAATKGHEAQFITITAPSKYHAYLSTGHKNKKYGGFSPRDTHEQLMRQWQRVRAQFSKQDIDVYGMRIVEPHHDETPHYHAVFFGAKDDLQKAVEVMRDYFTKEDREELKDSKVRFDAVDIDSKKGSAVGYIIKYLAKNIVSKNVNEKAGDDDETGKPITETAGKVVAWARTWGIRQFTFFGGASITPWRELRRMNNVMDNGVLEQLRQAAHNSDFGKYHELMQTLDVKPYAIETFNKETGEIVVNQYQEVVKQIKGIVSNEADVYISRQKEWRVVYPTSKRFGA